jgi:type II secretory pathway pseudopilin PulG
MRGAPVQRGFTYLWLLLAVAIIAGGLGAAADVVTTAVRRDKEAELLFVGDQFARAIELYRASSPGAPQYPQRLEDLLADNRFPNARRHLRRIYPDPITGSADWELVRGPNSGIVAVHSRSTARPLKTANFPKEYASFAGAISYREWVFGAAAPEAAVGSKPGASPAAGAPSAKGAATGTTAAAQGQTVRVPREPWACNAQRSGDLRVCDREAGPRGDEALEACRQSATRRYRDCLAGGQAEPLASK